MKSYPAVFSQKSSETVLFAIALSLFLPLLGLPQGSETSKFKGLESGRALGMKLTLQARLGDTGNIVEQAH